MLPKFFLTPSPKAGRRGLGEAAAPWQLGARPRAGELQLLIRGLLRCWMQRRRLLLKWTEGPWRGPTGPWKGRGQHGNYQRRGGRTAPCALPGSWVHVPQARGALPSMCCQRRWSRAGVGTLWVLCCPWKRFIAPAPCPRWGISRLVFHLRS